MRYMPSLKVFIAVATFVFSCAWQFLAAQDELKIISGKNKWLHHTDAANALYHHLAEEAYQHLDKRAQTITGYQSLSDWQRRQGWIKETMHSIVGPFPEKTPLNAKVTRVVKKDFYRVEHIIFESQPQFFVTGRLPLYSR